LLARAVDDSCHKVFALCTGKPTLPVAAGRSMISQYIHVDCRTLGRFSFLIPFWRPASAFSEWRVTRPERLPAGDSVTLSGSAVLRSQLQVKADYSSGTDDPTGLTDY